MRLTTRLITLMLTAGLALGAADTSAFAVAPTRAADSSVATSSGAAVSALAAWHCGSACSGQNPDTYPAGNPCGRDATTVSSAEGRGRTLQLRYSARCRTVWVRLYGGNAYDKVQFEEQAGPFWDVTDDWEYYGGNDELWSHMVDDYQVTIRACMQTNWPKDTRFGCTGGY
jgi:hypothetical protein